MLFSVIAKLNKIKKFPYFVCTPTPYSIGTAAEQLRVGVTEASILKKKNNYYNSLYFTESFKIRSS